MPSFLYRFWRQAGGLQGRGLCSCKLNKTGDYAPANSIQNQDLGARVWLKLSNFCFWTFQDQEARRCWVTAVLKTALLVKTKLLRSVSLLTGRCIFFITVLPISQCNCVSVPTAVFEGFGCISSPPKGRPHAEQKSPKGAGTPPRPQQLCCPAGASSPSVAAGLAKQPGSAGQWSSVVSDSAYPSRRPGPALTVWSHLSVCLLFTQTIEFNEA